MSLYVLLLWRNEVSYVSVLLVCYIFRRRISLFVIVFLLLDILHTKAPTIFWQKSDNKYLTYAKKIIKWVKNYENKDAFEYFSPVKSGTEA